MLNIPDSVKTLFKQDGVRKNFRVQFPNGELPDITNENIVQESVKFTESLCSQDVLKFGLTEASVLEFETVGVANMYGMTIEAGIEIDLSSLSAAELAEIEAGSWDGVYVSESDTDLGFPFFRVPYGVFRVESCPRDHQAMAHRKVQAYSRALTDFRFEYNTGLLWETVQADPSAVRALALGSDIAEVSQSQPIKDPPTTFLFDSTGARAELYFTVPGSSSSWDAIQYNVTAPIYNGAVDFVKAALPGYSPTRYEASGIAIADALTAARYSLIYDSSGTAIYRDNEDALRHCYPWLFSPCIVYDALQVGVTGVIAPLYQPLPAGTLMPILNSTEHAEANGRAFFVDDEKYKLSSAHAVYAGIYESGADIEVRIRNRVNYATVNVPGFLSQQPTVNFYKLTTRMGFEIGIKSTGELAGVLTRDVGSKSVKVKLFTYDVDLLGILNGCLELTAKFAKIMRDGNISLFQMSREDPETIAPGSYSNFWWDEYDVLPIGSAKYTFSDEEKKQNLIVYSFSSGLSVYDMTDNDLVPLITGMDEATMNGLLDEFFIPYLDPIAFTPVDLSMKGLPYLEAGDYLALTAEDGTIANSFAMRQTISGIQVLTAEIESTSGDIIESEEGET